MSEGSCRCGAVRFRADGPPLITMACHCIGCRRMSASAFSLSSLYSEDRFERSEGEIELGGLRGPTRHYFCASCMSWLYTVPEGLDEFVNVRSSMLADAAEHRPFIDVWLGEGLPWAGSGAERKFDAAPEESEFPQLMAAYAQWDGRVNA